MKTRICNQTKQGGKDSLHDDGMIVEPRQVSETFAAEKKPNQTRSGMRGVEWYEVEYFPLGIQNLPLGSSKGKCTLTSTASYLTWLLK